MKTITALLFALVAGVSAFAGVYQVGDTFETFTTKDQHDKAYTHERGTRLVIVAFAMSPGKAANAFYAKQPADFLGRHHAVFISNIHGMPGIGRAFALPKMRKYPHRILLADAEHFLDRYPTQEDKLTVLSLDEAGRITAIRFVDPAKELGSVFAPAK
ncbi:MAG: hypothetical protein QG602_4099 [Verrucomicrobiota bacterium]|nr:hypothetical protein [Verrucomicrobiota bacterium]